MSRKKPDLLTQQARLRRRHREKGQVLAIFRKPMRESLTSVLPITAIVLLLCFTVTPVSNNAMMAFLVGSLLLIVGMGLFSLGSEMSMIPLGEAVGKEITRSKKVWIIVAISFLIGVIITVAEPDLQVLASQVPAIENNVIIWSVALGVGVFLVIALLRILLGIPLSYLLIGFYAVVFTLAMFVSPDFWSIAFDSGGVTTGPRRGRQRRPQRQARRRRQLRPGGPVLHRPHPDGAAAGPFIQARRQQLHPGDRARRPGHRGDVPLLYPRSAGVF